eukprot:scpid112226/ scgid21331/ 
MEQSVVTATDVDTDVYHHQPQQKPGRQPIFETHPELVGIVTEYIQNHGFSAQSRRRSTVGNDMGVSLTDIREHVMKRMPEVREKGISRTAIHQLLVAPRQSTINAARYHGLVKARVPGKNNNLRK